MFINTDNKQAFEVNQLLTGKLRIDFKSIVLTNDLVTIEGNGFIYQNEVKELKLVFFRKILLDEHQELYFFNKREKGGLKKTTCEIKAIDNNDLIFTANCNFNPEFSQNIEEFKVYKLKSENYGQINRIIFYGNYKIPANSNYTTISTYKPYKESITFSSDNKIDSIHNSFEQRASETREMWKIDISEDIELNLCQFENYLEMLLLSHYEINDLIFNKILHTLDFLLGTKMHLVYYSVKNIGSCFFSFESISSKKLSMVPPIVKNDEPNIIPEYSKLFKSYFQYIQNATKEQYEKLLKSHRRIVASSGLYPFNFGQSLAIQIEYLAGQFFKRYKLNLKDDKEFKSDIKQIIDYVKNNCNFQHKGSKVWIIKRLEPGKSKEKWITAKLIKQMIADEAVYGKYNSWERLRNSAAHGNDNGSSHEKLIEWIYDCIEIYYTLIYYIIGHEGFYSRPSVDDFARSKNYKLPLTINEKSMG